MGSHSLFLCSLLCMNDLYNKLRLPLLLSEQQSRLFPVIIKKADEEIFRLGNVKPVNVCSMLFLLTANAKIPEL